MNTKRQRTELRRQAKTGPLKDKPAFVKRIEKLSVQLRNLANARTPEDATRLTEAIDKTMKSIEIVTADGGEYIHEHHHPALRRHEGQ